MQLIGQATNPPLGFVAALGILGGASLITAHSLTHRGPVIFLPYAAIVLASAFYLRYEHVQPFALRFGMALGAFMVATLILYLFISLYAAKSASSITALGHAWRLGSMFAIGTILSLAVAQLTATNPK